MSRWRSRGRLGGTLVNVAFQVAIIAACRPRLAVSLVACRLTGQPSQSQSGTGDTQASRGRLLSDPDWGSPIESRQGPRKIPFIDITDANERSAA